MAVYNAATYLRESIDSILNQSFTDFEFLLYNDGSTDNSAAIIRSYTDPRIILVDNTTNRGVSANMNDGIARTRGKYIVRMDADDIAYPERIARQVAYLEANPQVGLCGSAVRYIGVSETVIYPPQENAVIQQTLWLQNAFFQPAVIIRTSILREHNLRYDTRYDPAEDYKLWSEMSAVTQVHNLQEVLLDYRIHPHQISRRQSVKQQRSIQLIRQELMARLNLSLSPAQQQVFELLTNSDTWPTLTAADYGRVAALLDELLAKTTKVGIPPAITHQVVGSQWASLLGSIRHFSPALMPLIVRQPWSKYRPAKTTAKLLAKSLISWQPKS